MIQEILSEQNTLLAEEFLRTKKESCGTDGLMLSRLGEYLGVNRQTLYNQIMQGSYLPGIAEEVDILGYTGKTRTIYKLTTVDRFILRSIYQVLEQKIACNFSPHSYAYQSGRGVADAVKNIVGLIQKGNSFVVEVDIEKYFDNISLPLLMNMLENVVDDKITLRLIQTFLYCRIKHDFEITIKQKGVVQGSSLSPLFSNLYLNGLDQYLELQNVDFVRFGDDIKIFTCSYERGLELYKFCSNYLENKLFLTVNKQKSGVFLSSDRRYLGYEMVKKANDIMAVPVRRNDKIRYHSWKPSAIGTIGNDYHIITDGILNRKDYSILFENEQKKVNIPIETLSSINLYANVTLSSNFLKLVSKHNLRLAFFNQFGENIGNYMPVQNNSNARAFLLQCTVYNNAPKRLILAKKILHAAMHNMRMNLRNYSKNGSSDILKNAIIRMGENIDLVNKALSIEQLMLLEARTRGIYFGCYNAILKHTDFIFTIRSRRPPKDAINAMISFGNTLIYRLIAKEIYKTSLDIRISVLHSAQRRNENLNLDIAEIFKPIIVDRIIFSMINKHMIDTKLHFEYTENEAVFLNQIGKRLFLQKWYDKLNRKITLDGKSYTYEALIRQSVRDFQTHIISGEKYKPYKHQ